MQTLLEKFSNDIYGEEQHQLAKPHETNRDDCISKNRNNYFLDDIPISASSLNSGDCILAACSS